MSGEERTHHWLSTNMGQGASDREEDPGFEHGISLAAHSHLDDPDVLFDPHSVVPLQDSDPLPDEGLPSPVDSIDLDRNSVYSMDEEEAGPPSVETLQLEVSGITSTWLSSGGRFATEGSMQFGVASNPSLVDSALLDDEMPTLGSEVQSKRPFYGPALPIGPFSSPTHEPNPISYGDIPDESALSGICGLRNLGNTCFMSAGIQCLVNTPPIAQYFFTHQGGGQDIKGNLAGCFSQLIHKIWSGKYASLRPSDFKDAFGQQWRDFRDYRQHDCQEFVTLLLEALRKQMPVLESEEGPFGEAEPSCQAHTGKNDSSTNSISNPSCNSSRSSVSSRSSCPVGGSRESRSSSSPTPPQSPQCPPSPLSPGSLKNSFEAKPDLEDAIGVDSGPASPKSSVSSSSVDAHLISLRLQPIPEEVKDSTARSQMDVSNDDLSVGCQDAESVASDMSDFVEGANLTGSSTVGMQGGGGASGVLAVRQYNQLAATDICDNTFDCDTSCTELPDVSGDAFEQARSPTTASSDAFPHCLYSHHCDIPPSPIVSSVNNKKKEKGASGLPLALPLEKNRKLQLEKVSSSNNRLPLSLVKLEDILKESKTSNVNVLGKDSMSNNKLLFDSEKYAKADSKKIKNSVDNLTRAGIKRVKEVNLLVDKMDNSVLDPSTERGSKSFSSNLANSALLSKRMRLEEKNIQYELERNQGDYYECMSSEMPSTSGASIPDLKGQQLPSSSISSLELKLADQSWKSFIQDGKSAIVDTFYGQFRSSVACSVCGHTSIKFDPFGTLSVPLPHANEIQIPTIFVPTGDSPATRCLMTLCKVSTIKELKCAIAELLELQNENELIIAEVFDNHIARTVDDNYMTKFLNYNRSIYAFQLAPAPPCSEDDDSDGQETPEESAEPSTLRPRGQITIRPAKASPCIEEDVPDSVAFPGPVQCGSVRKKEPSAGATEASKGSNMTDAEWQQCNICLEEICQTDLKTHENCEDCLLCDDCIEMSCKHHGGGSVPCPVCHTRLSPCDLIPVAKRKTEKPKARILRVSVVFRVDTESNDNNKREMQLIGHPLLLSLPSRIKSKTLLGLLQKKLLPQAQFSLLLVDGRGYNCSRCLFSSHCRGCDAISGAEVNLQASDTLCIKFIEISPEQSALLSRVDDHPSLLGIRQNEPLTLYDCLRAFTQSETLKESESWFCPNCQKKQQATKTISVWRYPPYLIIHLERFLFHGTLSTKVDDKVIFPQDGLDLTDFVAGEQPDSLLYNLYGCVCHMGVAQAGHYTALVRSPLSREWHYFNDDSVTRQKPREEEYSTAYLLFYHRQGTSFNLNLPLTFSLPPELPPKWDHGLEEPPIESSSNRELALVPWDSSIANPTYARRDCRESSPVSTSEEELKNLSTKKVHNSSRESEASSFWDVSRSEGRGRSTPDFDVVPDIDNQVVSSSDMLYAGDEVFEQKVMGEGGSYHVSSFMKD